MSKRITDFFGVLSQKRHKTDEEVQSEQLNKHSSPQPSCSSKVLHDEDNIYNPNASSGKETHSDISQVANENHYKTRDLLESAQGQNTTWYKGSKLDTAWLLQTYSCFEKIKLGKRFGIKCTICFKHIQEAQKFSKNGRVPMADGVRYDGQKELERIIDHLNTEAHKAAESLDKMQQKWLAQSDKHPWIRTLKSHHAEKVKLLIELAVDVYNDSRQLTLSAHSWPSRSLSKIHADTQIALYKDDNLDSEFSPLNPSSALLQYRNPVIYREMLDIIGSMVMETVVDQLSKTDTFSLQVDGSVDKYGVDNKFITARFLTEDRTISSVFLGESKSDKRGAEGLLESIKIIFRDLGIENLAKEKLTGITTDGENANTGRKGGLWVRMKDYLKRDLLCVWCIAHRSDLALNDLESCVVEVRHWKANIKAIATFYRGSALRFEEITKISKELNLPIYKFPAYFEVRFTEHLLNLCTAVWKNLPSLQKHWEAMISSSETTKTEKATARGFLRLWEDGGEQHHLTSLMMDLLRIFETLQKDCQKSLIIMSDIELSKRIAIDSISLIEKRPYPGGNEEKLLGQQNLSDSEEGIPKRRIPNSLVYTKRCWSAVRKEVVLSCKEFLSQRLNVDQQEILDRINKFVNARTVSELVKQARTVVQQLFGEEQITVFTDDVVSLFASEKLPPPSEINTDTAKLFYYLKVSIPHSIFSKLIQAYISLTPHSAGPERAVSVHTILKTAKQSGYSREALNSRMYIAINGVGTAFYDPRPAVAKFLEIKERRRKLPDADLYQDHEFIKKFFKKTPTI